MEAITSFVDQYGALMAQGTWDTVVMTVLSTAFAYVIGIPLGVLLILTAPGGLHPHRVFNSVLGWLVNIGRSIPFIILIVFMIPMTRAIVGTSLGVAAAIVPLTGSRPLRSSLAWSSRALPKSTVVWWKPLRASGRLRGRLSARSFWSRACRL